jgi:hypothetical protein
VKDIGAANDVDIKWKWIGNPSREECKHPSLLGMMMGQKLISYKDNLYN